MQVNQLNNVHFGLKVTRSVQNMYDALYPQRLAEKHLDKVKTIGSDKLVLLSIDRVSLINPYFASTKTNKLPHMLTNEDIIRIQKELINIELLYAAESGKLSDVSAQLLQDYKELTPIIKASLSSEKLNAINAQITAYKKEHPRLYRWGIRPKINL